MYKQRCLELEKLKRDNASVKELEKAESKFRKAQDDYKSLVDKYTQIREDFERKMTLAAKHFQEVENIHLKQMREFIENYCQIVDNNNNLLGRVRNFKNMYIFFNKNSCLFLKKVFLKIFFPIGISGVPNSTYGFDSGKPFRTIYFSQTYRIRKARSV